MKTLKFIALILIPVVLVACTFTVNTPALTTGETQIFDVNEPLPDGDEVPIVVIEMGAGKLDLNGGSDQMIEGSITYNLATWAPVVTREGNTVTISQKTTSTISIPEGQIKEPVGPPAGFNTDRPQTCHRRLRGAAEFGRACHCQTQHH